MFDLFPLDFSVSKIDSVLPVFRLWSLALHSSSMSFKLLAFTTLADMISSLKKAILSATSGDSVVGGGGGDSDISTVTAAAAAAADHNENDKNGNSATTNSSSSSASIIVSTLQAFHHDLHTALSACLSLLPLPRLRSTAAKRLWHEMEDFPSYTRYIQVG